MRPQKKLVFISCLVVVLSLFAALPGYAQAATVRAVLFYSRTCGHCYTLITESLPPIIEQYGEQLQIIGVDVSQSAGQMLFQAAAEQYGLVQLVVPTLIIGDMVLIGGVDIPERLPGLVDAFLAEGGVDWPDIPGLAAALPPEQTPTLEAGESPGTKTANPPPPSASITPEPSPTSPPGLLLQDGGPGGSLRENLAADPHGNGLAIVVLFGMLVSVVYLGATIFRPAPAARPGQAAWLIPALCLVGLGVAGYLAYVETAQVTAVCGPVGDCNTVQQSPYARLFGILPIGVLGLGGYLAILAAWSVAHSRKSAARDWAWLAILGMATFGTLFSIYLTFLEPFVIGATCAWCLTSAIIMTALLWLIWIPGRQALTNLLNSNFRS